MRKPNLNHPNKIQFNHCRAMSTDVEEAYDGTLFILPQLRNYLTLYFVKLPLYERVSSKALNLFPHIRLALNTLFWKRNRFFAFKTLVDYWLPNINEIRLTNKPGSDKIGVSHARLFITPVLSQQLHSNSSLINHSSYHLTPYSLATESVVKTTHK